MSNTGQNVKDEAIRETAFGDITASYVAVGTALTHDCFTLVIMNNTNANIYVSTDGVTNNKKFSSTSGRVYDYKTNDEYRKAGTTFYIKHDGSAPTSGAFWIEVEYV